MTTEDQRAAQRKYQAKRRSKAGVKALEASRRNRAAEHAALRLRLKNPEKWLVYALIRAKHRAKKRGLEFNIISSDISLPTHCPVLGIELIYGMGSGTGPAKHSQSPSLDRMDNSIGYVAGNVYVISTRANLLKKDATLEELSRLKDYMEMKHHNYYL